MLANSTLFKLKSDIISTWKVQNSVDSSRKSSPCVFLSVKIKYYWTLLLTRKNWSLRTIN